MQMTHYQVREYLFSLQIAFPFKINVEPKSLQNPLIRFSRTQNCNVLKVLKLKLIFFAGATADANDTQTEGKNNLLFRSR